MPRYVIMLIPAVLFAEFASSLGAIQGEQQQSETHGDDSAGAEVVMTAAGRKISADATKGAAGAATRTKLVRRETKKSRRALTITSDAHLSSSSVGSLDGNSDARTKANATFDPWALYNWKPSDVCIANGYKCDVTSLSPEGNPDNADAFKTCQDRGTGWDACDFYGEWSAYYLCLSESRINTMKTTEHSYDCNCQPLWACPALCGYCSSSAEATCNSRPYLATDCPSGVLRTDQTVKCDGNPCDDSPTNDIICCEETAMCDSLAASSCDTNQLKDDAATRPCGSTPCNGDSAQLAECCKPKAKCDSFFTASKCSSQALEDHQDSLECASWQCVQATDEAKCCKPKATCDSHYSDAACPGTKILRNGAASIECDSNPCQSGTDDDTCCISPPATPAPPPVPPACHAGRDISVNACLAQGASCKYTYTSDGCVAGAAPCMWWCMAYSPEDRYCKYYGQYCGSCSACIKCGEADNCYR